MDFLQSFSLRDLLIFSPESYFKLFELANKALWPLHIPLFLLAIVAVVFIFKRHKYASLIVLLWLGLVWGFVGYSYFGTYYSQISTYSQYIRYLFWAEAFLLIIYAVYPNHGSSDISRTSLKKWRVSSGGIFVLYGLVIHPFVSMSIWNQPLTRIEIFSIAPDPTAIATIGFIMLLPVRGYLLLAVIPCLWLLFSMMTYQAF